MVTFGDMHLWRQTGDGFASACGHRFRVCDVLGHAETGSKFPRAAARAAKEPNQRVPRRGATGATAAESLCSPFSWFTFAERRPAPGGYARPSTSSCAFHRTGRSSRWLRVLAVSSAGWRPQYTGDGIMALFGAPIAHEDHAQRACYAALRLGEELRGYANELRSRRGFNFSVRMGLSSGEVVVGKIGDDLRMDYTAQGHTVGLAARMEQLAAADRVYLTETRCFNYWGVALELAASGIIAPPRSTGRGPSISRRSCASIFSCLSKRCARVSSRARLSVKNCLASS